MSKVLLLLAVVGLALWWFKRGRADKRPPAPPPRSSRSGASSAGPGTEPATMLACTHCGLHLPQADTLADEAGRPYCSEAHRRAGPR